MKRERRILAAIGDEKVVVSVLYRGKLWFEGVDVKILRDKALIEEVLRSKYLNQARTILIDEGLLKSYDCDLQRRLTALIPAERKVDVIVVKREGESRSQEHDEEHIRIGSQSDVSEALRVARKIFYEVRNVIQKVS